jgi:Tol biopolymer transport system component
MNRSWPLCAGLALLLAGCNSKQPNPFANATPIVKPKDSNAIVFTSNLWSGHAGAPREVYGVDADGANLTRMTFCNTQSASCDNAEAVPSPDGLRYAARRVLKDADGDGRLTPEDGVALLILDPRQGQEGQLTLRVASSSSTLPVVLKRISGVDWAPAGDMLVFSAEGEGGPDDLYRTVPRIDTDGSQTGPLSATTDVRERRPRMNQAGTYAAYERGDPASRSEVWLFQSELQQAQVTTGGSPGPPLADGSYAVGSDADPDFSPDGASLVFRRLTGPGSGTGTWEIYTVQSDGSSLARVAEGSVFRGAPDWGPSGIAFAETDANGSRLVTMKADGSERRVILSVGAGLEISAPRWRR